MFPTGFIIISWNTSFKRNVKLPTKIRKCSCYLKYFFWATISLCLLFTKFQNLKNGHHHSCRDANAWLFFWKLQAQRLSIPGWVQASQGKYFLYYIYIYLFIDDIRGLPVSGSLRFCLWSLARSGIVGHRTMRTQLLKRNPFKVEFYHDRLSSSAFTSEGFLILCFFDF